MLIDNHDFAYYKHRDEIEEEYGISKEDADNQRSKIFEDGGNIQELYKLLKSKTRVKYASIDNDFLNKLDDQYPGKNYSNLIKEAAKYYAQNDNLEKVSESILRKNAEEINKLIRNKKILNSLSSGMESPAREIWSSFFDAISEYVKDNSELNQRILNEKTYKEEDENTLTASPEIASFFINNTTNEDLVKAGLNETQINNLKSVAKSKDTNELNGNESEDKSESEDRSKSKGKGKSEDESKSEDRNNELPELTEEEKINKKNILSTISKAINRSLKENNLGTKDSPLKKSILNGLKKYGPDDYEGKYLPHINNNLDNRSDYEEIKEGMNKDLKEAEKEYKELPNPSEYRSNENSNNESFSKISEFIKDRFPLNFSKIDGNKIYLNDGRYLKAKITDIDKFTVTSFSSNNVVENRIELPLKIHKYKWFCSINDNIINKEI